MGIPTKIILFLAICQYANGYSTGAPTSVCDAMIPGHGHSPQTGASPYTLTLSRTAVSGFQPVDITLSGGGDNNNILGFLIQVRKSGGDGRVAGEFKVPVQEDEDDDDDNASTAVSKGIDCFGVARSAMTHTSNDAKKSVTVQWIAPNDADGEYQVYYSVVKNYSTFWAKIPHQDKIRVTRNPQAEAPAEEDEDEDA